MFLEENCKFSIPPGFLSNLTETLLSTFNSGGFSEAQINESLDRLVNYYFLYVNQENFKMGEIFAEASCRGGGDKERFPSKMFRIKRLKTFEWA